MRRPYEFSREEEEERKRRREEEAAQKKNKSQFKDTSCCFLRLLIKDGKASADCPLKIRFTPFFPDIIPRTDKFPVVALHLRHRRTREN